MLASGFASAFSSTLPSQPLLRPSPTGTRPAAASREPAEPPAGGWFDGASIGSCVVRRGGPDGWLMWYSGRSTGFAADVMPIATGCVGVATSADGLSWARLAGDADGGACLAPNAAQPDAFDATHVAVGDVVPTPEGGLLMYYFGGGSEQPTLGGRTLPRGAAMRIGAATSKDGLAWERCNDVLLAPSAALGQLFVGWPQLLPPDEAAGRSASRLFYHAATSDGRFAVGLATLFRTAETGGAPDPLTGRKPESASVDPQDTSR